MENKIRILLVDDSRMIISLLRRELKHWDLGEIVGEAHNGQAALDQVAATHPDLVLMDYRMPAMDGLEAAQHIKKLQGAPKIIMISTEDGPALEALARQAGIDGFCSKIAIHQHLGRMIAAMFACDPAGCCCDA